MNLDPSANSHNESIIEANELNAAIDNALPVLQSIRRDQRILTIGHPKNDPYYPSCTTTVAPYYMNRGDPPELGYWSVKVTDSEGHLTLAARVSTVPAVIGNVHSLQYGLCVKDDTQEYVNPQSEDVAGMIYVLGLARQSRTSLENTPRTPQRANILSRTAGRLVTKLFRRTNA